MQYTRNYGNLIWTDHALEKMAERGINQTDALNTFNYADTSLQGKNPGSIEYVKHNGPTTITLIAKQNEKGEHIVISVWQDPPNPGTRDARQKENYKKMQKASFWGKVWLTVRSQVGF